MKSPLSKEEFLEKLKTDREFNSKYGRKNITEGKMVLPPCHYGFQVYTRELSLEERRLLVTQEMFNQIYNGGGPESLSHKEINQWNVPTRAISLMWNQRSVDTFLGLPFNIASYGLLLEILAKEVNMVPDELIGNLGDTHLYLNHIEQAKEQIGRDLTIKERMDWWFENRKPNRDVCDSVDELSPYAKALYFDEARVPTSTREPYPLPKLRFTTWTNMVINDGRNLDWILEEIDAYEDWFALENYQSHPTIKAPLSN